MQWNFRVGLLFTYLRDGAHLENDSWQRPFDLSPCLCFHLFCCVVLNTVTEHWYKQIFIIHWVPSLWHPHKTLMNVPDLKLLAFWSLHCMRSEALPGSQLFEFLLEVPVGGWRAVINLGLSCLSSEGCFMVPSSTLWALHGSRLFLMTWAPGMGQHCLLPLCFQLSAVYYC